MKRDNGLSISLYSALANGVRLLAGPITLLLISKELNSEQIGFYYNFFSLIAMQQLAELGLGHTLKQYMVHAYKFDDDQWETESKAKIKGYVVFGFKWFSMVALFIALVVGPSGVIYFNGYVGDVEWRYPWLLLVILSALITLFMPVQLLLDATQNQRLVYQAQSISAFVNSVTIWVLLSIDAGLYTIPLALMFSNIVFYSLLYRKTKGHYQLLHNINVSDNSLAVFKELWPLLSKVSVTWGVGFLFWNGFNLIAFKIYDASYAGKVIFTIALARAGFGLAESIFSSQMTVISYKIAQGYMRQAQDYARRYQMMALSVLVFGYSLFCCFKKIMPDFFIFDKTVGIDYIVSIFLFFIAVLYLVTQNNFIRCFKIEPFVYVSIFQGVFVPVFFYLANAFVVNGYLYPCVLVMCFSIFSSKIIAKKIIADRSRYYVG